MTFQFRINDQYDLELDGKARNEMDIQSTGNGHFHILKNNQSFHCELVNADFQNRILVLLINGNSYRVRISDEYDELVNRLGLSASSGQKVKDVKAPMPGMVLEVLAQIGQQVQKGDGLLILEAMKMENIIKAQGNGIVKAVQVQKGQTVDKGSVLLEME